MSDNHSVKEAFSKLPLHFIPNHGQVDEKVSFYAKDAASSVFFTPEEVVFAFMERDNSESFSEQKKQLSGVDNLPKESSKKHGTAFALQFINANKEVTIGGQKKLQGKVNYLKGNDPHKWYTNMSTYQETVYHEIWPNIDGVFRGENGKLKYEWVVQPGADPNDIQLGYKGIDDVSIDREGNLEINTPLGTFIDERPISYQIINGKKISIDTHYVIEQLENGLYHYRFEVEDYDSRYPLIIDPSLDYSTYLGGSSFDEGLDIDVDSAGNAYVTGRTISLNFPTINAFQPTLNLNGDAFITKLSPDGSSLIFSTYLGGSGGDDGFGIAVDTVGSAYVTGQTSSTNFPTQNAFQPAFAGSLDAFVTKLSPDGSSLVFSTYLGGSSFDIGNDITVDTAGNAFVTGRTFSNNFPTTPGTFQTIAPGNGDAFVTKLSLDGSSLIFSTYLGGNSDDIGNGIAVDAIGSAYVTGITTSNNFPTLNAFQPTIAGSNDAFVTKLSPDGSSLVFSTYLGGGSADRGNGISVDNTGNIYVTGFTLSPNFPTQNPIQPALAGNFDAFITKMSPDGSSLVFSTYLGGSNYDEGFSIAVDNSSSVYVTGITLSSDFPTQDPTQLALSGSEDAFVTKLSPDGSSIVFSTYLGGSSDDQGNGIALDNAGNAYVVGRTDSSDFPTTPGAFQTMDPGNVNAFVTKFLLAETDLSIVKTDAPDPVLVGENLTYTVTVTNNGPSPATGVTIEDLLPTEVTFVSASPNCTFNPATNTVTCDIGNMAPGESETITIVVTPNQAGTIINIAMVSGNEEDPDPDNNVAIAVTSVEQPGEPSADLTITKTDMPDPVLVGETLTYTVTAINNGPSPATGVIIMDVLPQEATLVSIPSNCTFDPATNIVTCELDSLDIGESETIEIEVIPNNAGTITNMAAVGGEQPDPNPDNNVVAVETIVQFQPGVDPCEVVGDNPTVTCFLTDDQGNLLDPRLAISCQENRSAGDRENINVQLPTGEEVVLQKVRVSKQGFVVVQLTGNNATCLTEPIPFCIVETLILCAPEGTTLNCEVTDVDCHANLVCQNGLFQQLTIDLTICQSIQTQAEATTEIPARVCQPRPDIAPMCPPLQLPRQCPEIFPLANNEIFTQKNKPLNTSVSVSDLQQISINQNQEIICIKVPKVYDWVVNQVDLSLTKDSENVSFICNDT
ncbi:DUF7948 domain-containing protein [Gracilibacillus sp. D59]|uniref:DUF7948 domain-containing protein n=1 Tax=Gracilibacillus sp. D59 TaxID=3457434 RepID=UPI003FCCB290